MKDPGQGDTSSLPPLSSPTGSLGVQVDHDAQRVAFKMFPGNGHALRNGSYSRREPLVPDFPSDSRDPRSSMKEEPAHRGSTWMMDSSSQVYSGPEDNSTDPHETLTETSTLTLADAHTMGGSVENQSLAGVEMIYLKEFVLIDDDDDGDMSLREKTVTDFSVMDGKAAELVCGRLLSTSSCSLSECKDESAAPAAPPPGQEEAARQDAPCCFCTIL